MSEGAVVLRAPDGTSVRIDRFPTVLGRYHEDAPVQPDCDLSALDPESKVSRRHVSLDWDADHLVVTDLGSSNGSSLNGRQLRAGEPVPAVGSGVLTLGRLALQIDVEAAPGSNTERSAREGAGEPRPPGTVGGDLRLRDFADAVFRVFADPEVTHLVLEPGKKVRVRRAGEWGQTGGGPVSVDAWNAVAGRVFEQFSERGVGRVSGGYLTTLTDEAVLVEAVSTPLASTPVLIAHRRPAALGLSNLVAMGALDAASAAGLHEVVSGVEGVLITGSARSGRTAMLEALVDHVPRGARIVIVERRPAIRTVSPQAIRVHSDGGHGAAAVETALALTPDWIVIDDALPEAAAAATWLLAGGGTGVILAARALDAAEWRGRAVDALVQRGLDRDSAVSALIRDLPISVTMTPRDGGFAVAHIERLRAVAPPATDVS